MIVSKIKEYSKVICSVAPYERTGIPQGGAVCPSLTCCSHADKAFWMKPTGFRSDGLLLETEEVRQHLRA